MTLARASPVRLRSSTAPTVPPKACCRAKAAAYGVGIGIAVAEVEDVMVFADMIAKLGLANAHERYSGV